MIKKHLPISALILSLSAPALGQRTGEETVPPPAPDFRSSDSPNAATTEPYTLESDRYPIVPTTPTVLPPELMERPPLAPSTQSPNYTDQTRLSTSEHKPSLSWRARAHKLKQSPAAKQRTVASKYDAAIVTLIGTLPQFGLRVEMLNSKAGELLALPIDPNNHQKYIFVLSEMPPGTVTIKVAPWSQSKASNAMIEAILQSLEQSTPTKGGL